MLNEIPPYLLFLQFSLRIYHVFSNDNIACWHWLIALQILFWGYTMYSLFSSQPEGARHSRLETAWPDWSIYKRVSIFLPEFSLIFFTTSTKIWPPSPSLFGFAFATRALHYRFEYRLRMVPKTMMFVNDFVAGQF